AALVLQPDRRMKVLNRNRKILKENLSALQEWTDKHGDLFSFIPPRAGGIAFLKYSMNINSSELMTKLREEKSVFIVAGDIFGMDHYLRIGFGAEKDYLLKGLSLFDELLHEIK
ncbi:MAG: aminotransferase class I/II-fold pyridoxal phosphate-dependent enzyme, partial [Candidatus Aminicenantes bacterium]|nr:aminotransferase class I/II-fold pyridoxal phosphate-dependent enzyme [Candidatus Aminicenantes bacterium]